MSQIAENQAHLVRLAEWAALVVMGVSFVAALIGTVVAIRRTGAMSGRVEEPGLLYRERNARRQTRAASIFRAREHRLLRWLILLAWLAFYASFAAFVVLAVLYGGPW